MDFNEQQVALFTWGATETGSCNLIARAGTGKTTTIIELAKRISGSVFLGAFNKAIAEELKTRIAKIERRGGDDAFSRLQTVAGDCEGSYGDRCQERPWGSSKGLGCSSSRESHGTF